MYVARRYPLIAEDSESPTIRDVSKYFVF